MTSKYDALHDKYNRIATTKSGTRYERLTAFVFKIIHQTDTVIHDLKLIGDSEVKHQIDVTIEKRGEKKKRVLIECKDYDISGDKVGLDILRNFFGVVEDVKPDEAMVITCNGFTSDAQKYAKAKNIKLAVLRCFEDKDWEGRIKNIALKFHIQTLSDPEIGILLNDEGKGKKLQQDMANAGMKGFCISKGEPVYVHLPKEKLQINEFIAREMNNYPRDKAGSVELITAKNGAIEIENRGPVEIDGIKLTFEIYHFERETLIASQKVAEMILTGFDGTDLIIFDNDIKRLNIDDENGEVKNS